MFNKLGFQNKIFMIFFSIFIVIIASFSYYLYSYIKMTLMRTEQNSLTPATQKVSDQIDMMYKQLNYASLGFTYNQQNAEVMLELNNSDEVSSDDLLIAQNKLIHNLDSIYNVVNDLYKVIIFVPDKNIFVSYVRNEHLVQNVPASYVSQSSSSELFASKQLFTNLPAHPDDWSTQPETVVSVVRKFSNAYNSNFGMIELQLPYRTLEEICTIQQSKSKQRVLIFDQEGKIIYPYQADLDQQFKQQITPIFHLTQGKDVVSGEIRLDERSQFFNAYQSSYTGWTTAIVDDGTFFAQNIKYYRNLLLTISIFLLLSIVVIYYIILRRLTRPLVHLTQTIREVNLNNLTFAEPDYEGREYNEFKMLHRSFEHMINKLRASISSEYEARLRAMEANYSALQAQINPHFMFNTLNVIAAHCEESDSDIAADMCFRLSEMLRYTANLTSGTAPLGDELKYSHDYLELMKLHYDHSLFYTMDIPEAMHAIKLPKLSLQPFVENCIDHGFEQKLPPWNIRIKGHITDLEHWEILIEDDGAGFPPATLYEIEQKLNFYKSNLQHGDILSNLQISGMGIMNTYIRLMIHFGEHFYFHISNLEGSGSRIRFGMHQEGEMKRS